MPDRCLASSACDLAKEDREAPLDICTSNLRLDIVKYQSATAPSGAENSVWGEQTFVPRVSDDDLGLVTGLPCDTMHVTFGTPTLDEPVPSTTSSRQTYGKVDHFSGANLTRSSKSYSCENLTLGKAADGLSAFLPDERSNCNSVPAGSLTSCDASALAMLINNKAGDEVASVCCGLTELRICAEVNSDSSALETINAPLFSEEEFGQSMDQANNAPAKDQTDILPSDGALVGFQKTLLSCRHLEHTSKDFSKFCAFKVENATEFMESQLERQSLNNNMLDQEFMPLEQQNTTQITSTPVKRESLLSPGITLNCDILEGSFSGNCYHRDGSRLGKFKAIVSSFPLMLLIEYPFLLCWVRI